MIASAPIKILLGTPDVIGLVGNKIYPSVIPKHIKNPAVRVNINSDDPLHCKDVSTAQHNFSFQVDCYTDEGSEQLNLVPAVLNALDGNSGNFAGIEVINIKYENFQELYEDQSESFRTILNFTMKTSKL